MEKQRWEESERRRKEVRRSERRKGEKKEDASDVAPEGRKVTSLKRRVRSHLARWKIKKMHAVAAWSTFGSKKAKNTTLGPLFEVEMSKKCTPLWRKAHFQVKTLKTRHARTTFGRPGVEKVYAIVAASTFPSQKCKKLGVLSLLLTFRCRKSALSN